MIRRSSFILAALILALSPQLIRAQTAPAAPPATVPAATQVAPQAPDPALNLPAGTTLQKDLPFATPKGAPAPLKLDIYFPPPGATKQGQKLPTLLRLSPQREQPARPAAELLSQGYALIYAQYLPDDAPRTLTFHQFPEDLFAAKAAVRWIRGNAAAQNFDTDRIGIWAAGNAASLAATLAMTADQKDLAGTLGDFPNESTAVRSVCLFSGTTDWRYAELYGDETVNLPDSSAYQLFTGNAKDFPEATRKASAITYVRPNSPPVLMVTLASDSNRAMHLIFAETLHRAGVPSALYEEPPGAGAGLGGRAVDEAKLDKTILEFFADTLAGKTAPSNFSVDEQITRLTDAGLYKQARRLVEEQVDAALPNQREPWLKRIREITQKQQAPALKELLAAIEKRRTEQKLETRTPKLETSVTWTSREVLTDPEHIGEYHIIAQPTAVEFDLRASALRQVETLNNFLVEKDLPAADHQAALIKSLAATKQIDPALADEFLARFAEARAHADQAWPQNIKPIPYALSSGHDLYGFWFTMRAGGAIQRFRYIPAGKFDMGSSRDEWGRLPDEPILEPTEIKEAFWLADADVTQETWEGVMGKAENRSNFKGPKLPATNLSYAHSINFLDKLGVDAKLPTAAQWEYACRAGGRGEGGSHEMFPVTGRPSDSSWFWDEAAAPPGASPEIRILSELETDRTSVPRSIHPVKQKLPNKWGLYDMQGNVWQWCAGTSPEKPRDFHLAKGGSWISLPQSCRAARSAWFPIEEQSWNLGLRILIPAQ